MAIIDIILLLCFVPAVIQGIRKGFVRQAIELIAIFVGVWLAFHFSTLLSGWLGQYVSFDRRLLHVICFGVIVLITIAILWLLAKLITSIIKVLLLGWINGLLGVVFAIFKIALVLGLLILLFEGFNSTLHLIKASKVADAQVYQALKHFAELIFPYLKTFILGLNG